MPAVATADSPLVRPDYQLQDNLWAERGSVCCLISDVRLTLGKWPSQALLA